MEDLQLLVSVLAALVFLSSGATGRRGHGSFCSRRARVLIIALKYTQRHASTRHCNTGGYAQVVCRDQTHRWNEGGRSVPDLGFILAYAHKKQPFYTTGDNFELDHQTVVWAPRD
jgi:hypothetical protein